MRYLQTPIFSLVTLLLSASLSTAQEEHYEAAMHRDLHESGQLKMRLLSNGDSYTRASYKRVAEYDKVHSESFVAANRVDLGRIQGTQGYAKCYSTGKPMDVELVAHEAVLVCMELVAKSSSGQGFDGGWTGILASVPRTGTPETDMWLGWSWDNPFSADEMTAQFCEEAINKLLKERHCAEDNQTYGGKIYWNGMEMVLDQFQAAFPVSNTTQIPLDNPVEKIRDSSRDNSTQSKGL